MLEYSKNILRNVSFDIKLFRKELSKAYQRLVKEDVDELRKWVEHNFGADFNLQPIYVKK